LKSHKKSYTQKKKCMLCGSGKRVRRYRLLNHPRLTVMLCRECRKMARLSEELNGVIYEAVKKGYKLSNKEQHYLNMVEEFLNILYLVAYFEDLRKKIKREELGAEEGGSFDTETVKPTPHTPKFT